jgi:DNA-binding HxlR family transcriptional regulator
MSDDKRVYAGIVHGPGETQHDVRESVGRPQDPDSDLREAPDVHTELSEPGQVDSGKARGSWTHRQWTPLAHALAATGDRWTLLIVLAVGQDTLRLTRLRERLPGVSTGVLDHHVRQMVALGLLSRRRFREMPPRVELQLTDPGRGLIPIARALTRWGMCNAWSAPGEREQVGVDALLRSMPVLLEEKTDLLDGSVEAILASADARLSHKFQIEDGRLHATDEADRAASARIEGDEHAWIAALGPARDHTALRFTGRKRLAKQILDALPGRS